MTTNLLSPHASIRWAAISLLLLAPCAHAAEIGIYCLDGSRVELIESPSEPVVRSAKLWAKDGTAALLHQVPSANSELFRDEIQSLEIRGDVIQLNKDKDTQVGCSRAPLERQEAARSSFIEISGKISYEDKVAARAGAVLTIKIVRLKKTRPELTLSEQEMIIPAGSHQIDFTTLIDRGLTSTTATLGLLATVRRNGKEIVGNRQSPYRIDLGLTEMPLSINLYSRK